MGASGWDYIVPYQADLQAALDDLRRQVFSSGDYISPVTQGLAAPESVEALARQEQAFGTVCAFTDDEYEDYFGSTRPARADWDRFREDPLSDEYVAERWTGRAMVIWADDAPAEIAFWGYSGD